MVATARNNAKSDGRKRFMAPDFRLLVVINLHNTHGNSSPKSKKGPGIDCSITQGQAIHNGNRQRPIWDAKQACELRMAINALPRQNFISLTERSEKPT